MNLKFGLIITLSFVYFILSLLSPTAQAQISNMQGEWILDTDVPGADYGVVVIDNQGNVTFNESYPYDIGDAEYIFDVGHTGKVTSLDMQTNDFVYGGVGTGPARDTNGTITVRLDVSANGVLSSDSNMIVGVWYNSETYNTPQGVIPDEDAWPYTLIRKGYDPGEPGEEVQGAWQITFTGQNLSWTGEVILDASGMMKGNYSTNPTIPDIPLAGLYTFNAETKEFTFAYTTMATLPLVGETQVKVTGTGKGNEDNTLITGTWIITVEVKGRSTSFNGTFEFKKIADTYVADWDLL
jgi:hypothetical protein